MISSGNVTSAQYVVAFEERLLGGKCKIEVAIDLNAMTASSMLSMESILSTRPVFSASLVDLKAFAEGVRQLKARGGILASTPEDATAAQLNCTINAASAIVFQANGKPVRYSLNLGSFNQSGDLDDLNLKEIDAAIRRLEQLESRTLSAAQRRGQINSPAATTIQSG